MITELAQLIALTSYGNEYLVNGNYIPNFFPRNSVFGHCSTVDFHDFRKTHPLNETIDSISAANPEAWFKLLKNENCKKIRLYYQPSGAGKFGPEYMLAGFAGGAGTWLIETIYNGYSNYWAKRWRVENENPKVPTKWVVNYGRNVLNEMTNDLHLDIEELKMVMNIILTDIEDLAHKEGMESWAKTFAKAKLTLNSAEPSKEYYHYDMLVDKNYSVAARQLIFAAGNAWVFGGMGWWNDNSFNDKERYELLTSRLYEFINKSIVSVANSF